MPYEFLKLETGKKTGLEVKEACWECDRLGYIMV